MQDYIGLQKETALQNTTHPDTTLYSAQSSQVFWIGGWKFPSCRCMHFLTKIFRLSI